MSTTTSTSVTINDTMINQTVTFRSKNINDTTVYTGTIDAVGNYIIGQVYQDIIAYNAAVRMADPTVNQDTTQLTYFVVSLINTASQQTVSFSPDWILSGSFSIISQSVSVNVLVYDSATSDHTGILTALRAAGYSASITSVSS